jgi:alpha-glucoside transport system substrate-binding protein
VTVLIPWSRSSGEYEAFTTVTAEFTHETGIQVDPESTRAVTQELDADLNADDPPDLVDLSSPAALEKYQELYAKPQPGGKRIGLRPLDVALNSYDQPWRSLAQLGTNTAYAVPVKADVTSLIWYPDNDASAPPTHWSGWKSLAERGTPWCLGLASGSASGWPGADWVANILLATYPADTYKEWLAGKLAWTSGPVRESWQTWGTLMRGGDAIDGGASGALQTSFDSLPQDGMKPGGCEFKRGALAATGLSATDYTFVPFPSSSGADSAPPIMVAGDFMGLFTDNPNAAALLRFLAGDKAQTLWVKQPKGNAFSADSGVKLDAYPPGVRQSIAKLLPSATTTTLCFDTDDMMVPDMATAFEQAVLDYVANPKAAYLTNLLTGLQRTQNGLSPNGATTSVANDACAGP